MGRQAPARVTLTTMKPIAGRCPCAKQATRGGPERQGGGETGQDSARALPLNRMFFYKYGKMLREISKIWP